MKPKIRAYSKEYYMMLGYSRDVAELTVRINQAVSDALKSLD